MDGYRQSACVDLARDQIVELLSPKRIILYNQRLTRTGQTSSFKLCVIVDTPSTEETERQIYLELECDIPFDVLVYTPQQWEEISSRADSFASKIQQTGLVLYG